MLVYLLLELEWQQELFFADLNNTVIWMVSIFPLISNSSYFQSF